MRIASSWHQFLLLAAASLGILFIMISVLRLTDSDFLRRLMDRNSKRRSEVFVELIPLSVAPATSAYTSKIIEIEPLYVIDRVAFVCDHTKRIVDANKAADDFKELIDHGAEKLEKDKDRKIVLTMWHSFLSLEEVVQLVISLSQMISKESYACFDKISSASLSFRITDVSPTQIVSDVKSRIWLFYQWKDVMIASEFVTLLIEIQIINFRKKDSSSIFWMSVCEYLDVVVFTFELLLMIKKEIVAKLESLSSVFKDAYWIFSDSRHAKHRSIKRSRSNILIIARPAQHSSEERRRRNYLTSLTIVSVIVFYVVWYLSLRVSSWWVTLDNLEVIWLTAAYRAMIAQNLLIASEKDVENNEHWIEMFRNIVSEFLLATFKDAEHRAQQKESEKLSCVLSSVITRKVDDLMIVKKEVSATTLSSRQTILFVVSFIKTDLRTWSSIEDVMEVGLKIIKRCCQQKILNLVSQALSDSDWLRLVRFKMTIYVLELIWKATRSMNFALSFEFDLESLVRHVMKLLHVCMNHEEEITRHSFDWKIFVELSHVLCESIADSSVNLETDMRDETTIIFRKVLTTLHDNDVNSQISKFSLKQIILLSIITLACTYDRWLRDVSYEEIVKLQRRHIDGLELSERAFLGIMKKEFEILNLWDDFMMKKNSMNSETQETFLHSRDVTVEQVYALHNMRDYHTDHTRQTVELKLDRDENFVSRE